MTSSWASVSSLGRPPSWSHSAGSRATIQPLTRFGCVQIPGHCRLRKVIRARKSAMTEPSAARPTSKGQVPSRNFLRTVRETYVNVNTCHIATAGPCPLLASECHPRGASLSWINPHYSHFKSRKCSRFSWRTRERKLASCCFKWCKSKPLKKKKKTHQNQPNKKHRLKKGLGIDSRTWRGCVFTRLH